MGKKAHLVYWNKKTGKMVQPDLLKQRDKKSSENSQVEPDSNSTKGKFIVNFDRQIKKAVRTSK